MRRGKILKRGKGCISITQGVLLKFHSGHLGWDAFLMNSRVG